MARTHYTFTFTNAQPESAATFDDHVLDHLYADATSSARVGPQIVLNASNSVSVWSDAAQLTAFAVDAAGQQLQATATKANPSVTCTDGTPGVSPATYLTLVQAAMEPDLIMVGAITRDSNGAATSASVVWPDGNGGTYTADTVSTAFPGSVDAYHITRVVGGVTTTYTQAAVTRDATTGAVTNRPAITVA